MKQKEILHKCSWEFCEVAVSLDPSVIGAINQSGRSV